MRQSELPDMPPKARHVATYATDKRKGGYLVRVEGPDAAMFAGRDVVVTVRSGTKHSERLDRLIWSGTDAETRMPVALYSFLSKPRETTEVPF